MIIKKFNEMYQDDDTLGTIRDIIESNILDEYDVELENFGWGTQTSFQLNLPYGMEYRRMAYPSILYGYELPSGESIALDKNGEDHDVDLSLYEVTDQFEFLMVELRCSKSYLQENLEIIDKISSSIKMIESMTNLGLVDMSVEFFQNSISSDDYSLLSHINWKNPDMEKLGSFYQLEPAII
jgi:hypothetical protein